jgi:hypothetical protein
MDLGIADDGQCAGHKQEAQIANVAEILANPPDVVVAATLQGLLAMQRDASASVRGLLTSLRCLGYMFN